MPAHPANEMSHSLPWLMHGTSVRNSWQRYGGLNCWSGSVQLSRFKCFEVHCMLCKAGTLHSASHEWSGLGVTPSNPLCVTPSNAEAWHIIVSMMRAVNLAMPASLANLASLVGTQNTRTAGIQGRIRRGLSNSCIRDVRLSM